MLGDLIEELVNAKDKDEKEKVFRELEKVGMDRITAICLAREHRKEREADGADHKA